MKIKNIKINNYGNLENKEIALENKINIIYGKNESGKSTLLNYIKSIFYGISKNKNGKEISDYEKYKPWTKNEFSGKLKYELDDGEVYEIFRDFNKKNPKIFNNNLEDISKQFNIDKKEGLQFFLDQTKVDETMFLSTIVSMQQEVKLDRQSQGILIQKIANLAGTGDDSISFKRVLDRLNKRQLEEIGTERTKEKPINIISEKIKKIEFVIKEINFYKNNKEKLEEQKNKIIQNINKQNDKYNIIKILNEILQENKIEKEKINLKNKIKNEIKEKIQKLNIEKNSLLKNKEKIDLKKEIITEGNNKKNKGKNQKKYFILFLIFLILFILIKLINIFFIKNNYLDIFNYFFIPIYFIYLFIKIKLNKKIKVNNLNRKIEEEKLNSEINILNVKIENIENQLLQYKKEEDEHIKEINQININLDFKIDKEIEKIKQKYDNAGEILENIEFDNIEKQIIEVQEELNRNKVLLHSIILEEENIIPKLEDMITLEEEYINLKQELKELEEKDKNIKLTKEYLIKAYEKMKMNITPKFTQNLSNNISQISNNKYNKITISDDNGLIVENEFGEYVPVDRLSVGTIEQLYLSLRLSMLEDISKEKMPIILDEAFAYYDEIRLENILKFLVEKAENHQVIIFTCTNREKEIFNKLGVQYNLVEL